MAGKPVPQSTQLSSVQPEQTIPAPTDTPAKEVYINPKRLNRFIAQPEDIKFLPTRRDEGDDGSPPVAPPAEQASKKPGG